jgi:hypothetical protein
VEIDTALAGTYARPNESSRRLTLTLDGPSSDALVAAYIEAVEAEAALEGVDVQAALVIDRAKVILVVRPRRATGTATAKLKAKFKLSGTATVAGVGSVPAKVVGKIKGTSELVGLAP